MSSADISFTWEAYIAQMFCDQTIKKPAVKPAGLVRR
jgi:hypothetical protein